MPLGGDDAFLHQLDLRVNGDYAGNSLGQGCGQRQVRVHVGVAEKWIKI